LTLVDRGVVGFGNLPLNTLLARTRREENYEEFDLLRRAIFMLRAIGYSLTSYPSSVRLWVANDEELAGLLGNTIALAAPLRVVLVAVMAIEASAGTTASGRCDEPHPGASTHAARRAAVR
jgi:hypothetical protein